MTSYFSIQPVDVIAAFLASSLESKYFNVSGYFFFIFFSLSGQKLLAFLFVGGVCVVEILPNGVHHTSLSDFFLRRSC